MELGEKIRAARLEKNMTQSDVASDKITRNMLSAIESGKATPSLDTLLYISAKLELPIHYLLSDDIPESQYRRNTLIPIIKEAFAKKQYSACIHYAKRIDDVDDEIAYMLAYSHFELGVASAKSGAFVTADKNFSSAEKYAEKTIYDTDNIRYRIPLYLSFVRNVNAPLLDLDLDAFKCAMSQSTDLELFKYVCNDWEYQYENPMFKKHAMAKIKIRERRYYDAITLLLEISEDKSDFETNAYLMYGVYGDLENCYKQILDFENAYKYVTKRMSMLEGFNS